MVFMTGALEDYIVRLVRGTRSHPDVLLGVSPRGSRQLYHGSKAAAFIRGRDYVLPDDIKSLVTAVFSHRLLLKPEARLRGRSVEKVLAEILLNTQVPVVPDAKG
jgi:MoxR-like ATPase